MPKAPKNGGYLGKLLSTLGRGTTSVANEPPLPVLQVVEQENVRVVYQPIVDLTTGLVFAYEALARCPVPGLENPLHLFRAATEQGLTGRLGRILRRMAVEQCHTHPLFLNINPNEFDEGWLVRPDDPIFVHSEAVYVEITESVPLSHFELCHGVLNEIRSKGVRLAVDDLGAGFSNLKYIADLDPEVVKLDRALVASIDRNPRQLQLVRAVVRLCHEMSAKVVAEGIETEGELRAAQEAGADYGQGFLLAYPEFPPPHVTWTYDR